ncbi:MAG: phosphatidylglycerophosphatase A [Clostridia bacterium]|nr:phosphatidylglycerophosphatase A [Clostridia bacterium]MCL6521201.1 phosphatidylglycerophosphatase A [Bacillota bacterium]
MRALAEAWLARRGVTLEAVAELVLELQAKYVPGLTLEACRESVERVLEKREVQNAIFTGIALDELAERGRIAQPLGAMLRRDDSLYGIDEVLALSITNVYGSIGLTNFGYLDKTKPGVIGRINNDTRHVNTFLDDLVSALAAAAAARIAHAARDGDRPRSDGL